jgi:peptidyl-prolyl cis-trans isomerase SurA
MKRKISLIVMSLCLGAAGTDIATAQTRELGASGELLDGVAALVDSGVVLKSELRDRLTTVANNFIQQQMQLPPEQRSQLPPRSELEQQVLERLILEEIQVQRARAIGIEIGDDTLNQAIDAYAAQAGLTLEELPAILEAEGEDYQRFREDWRRDLTIRQLERVQVVSGISINPRELQQCLAQAIDAQTDEYEYNISHILIGFSPDAESDVIAAAEERARGIVRQLDDGADFAQLAIANSESQTALEGGALGWRKGSALPTIFADDVRSMEVGEHSTPIRSTGGFHIVRLNDVRGVEPQLVDQIRARHILLTPTEVLDDEATRQRLLGIRDQIVAGDEFATVASAVSEDSASAVDGGDLGWSTPDDFVPEFSAVLTSLEIGELSEPFRTPYGWHIAEVTGRRSYDMTDDLRDSQCRNQIGGRKVEEELDIWRRRIRDEAYVVKRL